MFHRTFVEISLVLCIANAIGAAQVRQPPRTRTGALTPTTTPPSAPTLTVSTLSHDSISGGPGPNQPNGKVTLSGPALTGGLQVTLASNNAAVTIPASVVVPAGATEITFPLTTAVVAAPAMVQITARSGSVSLTDSFKLLLRIVSLTPEPAPPGDGTRAAWRVTLSGPAPAGGITPTARINAGSYGGGTTPCQPTPVFTQPFIPAGSTSGVLEIRADPSLYKAWPWVVVYGYHAAIAYPSEFLTRPSRLTAVDVPATITGGTASSANLRLSGATPGQSCAAYSSGAVYDLEYTFYFRSSSPLVQLPVYTRVDPGQSERAFRRWVSLTQRQRSRSRPAPSRRSKR